MDKIFSKNIVSSISILWIVLIFCLLILKRSCLPALELNEIGDFVAGVFAPLGFFWLVAGFYQQGRGLDQNSQALKLQAIELEKTTQALGLQVQEMKLALEQQTIVAETTKKDLELSKKVFENQIRVQDKNNQPFFHFDFINRTVGFRESDGVGLRSYLKECKISNSRSTCRDINIYCEKDGDYQLISHINYLDEKSKETLNYIQGLPIGIIYESDPDVKVLFNFKIKYLDQIDCSQEQDFALEGRRNKAENKIDIFISRI